MWGDISVNFIVAIISQYICVSNHSTPYIYTMLDVNYISMNLEKMHFSEVKIYMRQIYLWNWLKYISMCIE